METLKISAVSYLNTFPFVFGIRQSGFLQNFSLELDVPSRCADKLWHGKVDIALVPVAVLPEFGNFHIISDYCIGAVGEVKTVLLLSKVPLEQITRVHLDPDSRTSVELVKVLAGYYWKVDPVWDTLTDEQALATGDIESLVAIGDKTFRIRQDFKYVYDLAAEWVSFTGLPFVFAVWVSRKRLPDDVIHQFTKAISYGIERKSECLEYFSDKLPECDYCLNYLEKNISYDFDERKKEGLKKFLGYINNRKS
ncbi:MAG: menaquinone biosynthesis protein [Bacteroidales bacterium]|nr:menaquinone biosynthesis protein [Bacteroidales bacterium]